jgi:hypothetical protein
MASEHERGGSETRRIRETPAVDVKHRGQWEHDIATSYGVAIDHELGHRVEHHRSM